MGAQTVQNFAIRSRSNRKFTLNLEFLLANRPRKEVYYKRKCSHFSGWEAGHHKQQCARRGWERMEVVSQTTKRALEASLKKLLLQKPLNKITINDITEDCGVNRMTFYYHFKDIYDLVEWSCQEDAAKALAGKKTYETWQQGFEQIFEAVLANKPFIMNVYHSVSREQVENYLYKVTYDLLEGVVEEQAQGMSVRDEDKAFIATVYKYAFVGLMLDWIKNDMKGDSQLLVDRLELVIHGNVRAALERLRIDKA